MHLPDWHELPETLPELSTGKSLIQFVPFSDGYVGVKMFGVEVKQFRWKSSHRFKVIGQIHESNNNSDEVKMCVPRVP